MAKPDVQSLRKLLAENQLEELFAALLAPEAAFADAIRDEALTLSGRFKKLRDENQKGILSVEQSTLEENRIRNALALLIKAIQQPTGIQKINSGKQKWVVPALLYAVSAAGLLWWLFQPMSAFRIEADLMAERVSFKYLSGPTDFAQGQLRWLGWQNYAGAQFEGERLQLDRELDGTWELPVTLSAALRLHANPDIPGTGIQFGPARLEKLQLESGAQITFSRPKEEESLLRLSVQQTTGLKGDLSYSGSLTVQAEQFELEGLPGETDFLSPVQMRIEPPAGLAREVTLTSFSGSSTLDLTLADTLLLESNNLAVTELSFYQPIENMALPTILSGEIRIAEVDKPLARTLPVAEGEALDLTAVDRFALEKISIRPEGISLRLSGLVSRLETGKYHDVRNPLRLEWLWCNHRTLLIALGVAFLGLALFLPPKIRERIFEVLKLVKGF